ncbi:MAG: hypothetical protein RAK21_10140 [Synechococcus sp. SP2 MAG]|jgi:hypothetical protein|nr:hypothetical protein [Synechococcus sp. SP2 MAG]
MNQLKTVLALIGGIWLLTPNAATAQTSRPLPLTQPKAANLARMRAESLNGGLGQYRAASCMYETGAGSCLESISNKGFQFLFQGGAPGWQQQTPPNPTIETSVLVSRDGDRILEVSYNGTIR